jgi:hypothetical protein
MKRSIGKRVLVALLSISMVGLGFSQAAGAGIVTTQRYLELQSPPATGDRLNDWLASADVQQQLVAMGVPPAAVEARIAAMTPAERAQLNQRLDEMPAGGDVLVLIGAVFLVLLILELVGVIDIFKKV